MNLIMKLYKDGEINYMKFVNKLYQVGFKKKYKNKYKIFFFF